MGCYRYRKIKNPIDPDRVGFYDKSYISIPDCRCSKCRKAKQNDWLVRSYFEYTSKPTTAFFVTLDFDDDHLPRYDGVPCFDSRLMTNFFETLRKCSSLPPFRYLYACDYGGFLQRPHYHLAFLFDKDSVRLEDFEMIITWYWKHGSHENIQQVNPRYSNPLKAFEYVCKYTTKELDFSLKEREKKMPKQYRSNTYASVGYGAQALDPAEFKSKRLIKEGIVFQEHPSITRDIMLSQETINLKLNDNGKFVPFRIPRYYELKLMYDYKYDNIEKKSHLYKNTYGSELSDIRHNSHYNQMFDVITSSRSNDITSDILVMSIFNQLYPESPYVGMTWHDIYDDIFDSDESLSFFYEVCKIYDFLDFSTFKEQRCFSYPTIYYSSDGSPYLLSKFGCYGVEKKIIPYYDVDLYIQVITYYNIWKTYHNLKAAHYEDWLSREENKKRLLSDLKLHPYKRLYLERKNYNFNRLKFKPYVPFNLLRSN